MKTLTVAKEIASQIGKKALFMIGAKDLVGGDDFLLFRFMGSNKFNYLKIELTVMDDYTMTFMKIRNCETIAKKIVNGVYCDMLGVIEEQTGLYTSL